MKTDFGRGYQPGPFSCRRRGDRKKVYPSGVTCWTGSTSPSKAVLIEADTKGARLLLPWAVEQGQEITVSFSNEIGLHRTERARIAWVQRVDTAGRTIAGLYYCGWQRQAA